MPFFAPELKEIHTRFTSLFEYMGSHHLKQEFNEWQNEDFRELLGFWRWKHWWYKILKWNKHRFVSFDLSYDWFSWNFIPKQQHFSIIALHLWTVEQWRMKKKQKILMPIVNYPWFMQIESISGYGPQILRRKRLRCLCCAVHLFSAIKIQIQQSHVVKYYNHIQTFCFQIKRIRWCD